MKQKRLPAIIGVLLFAVFVIFAFLYKTPRAKAPTATFGGVSLNIELATTTAAMERGLGGRTTIPDNYGMLFVFPQPGIYGFWMKDMLVPIDIFWLDAKGHVVTLKESVATSTYPSVFEPTASSTYVLETRAGFGAAHDIEIGSMFKLQN